MWVAAYAEVNVLALQGMAKIQHKPDKLTIAENHSL